MRQMCAWGFRCAHGLVGGSCSGRVGNTQRAMGQTSCWHLMADSRRPILSVPFAFFPFLSHSQGGLSSEIQGVAEKQQDPPAAADGAWPSCTHLLCQRGHHSCHQCCFCNSLSSVASCEFLSTLFQRQRWMDFWGILCRGTFVYGCPITYGGGRKRLTLPCC